AGMTVLTQFTIEGAWEGLRSKWILIGKDGNRIEHEFVQRLYSAIELKRMMLASGFRSAEIYGDFDFSPYNEKARTMVIVARK
ncbi:MAG TPA: class I SAM-dependent methyltransferase, partial [Treponema sp.]|nr:class I SAM-dependent methyltransferase [Treponema sp.]